MRTARSIYLPDELWQHILDYCVQRLPLRAVSMTMRQVLDRCAFPRKLTRRASIRWFRESAFQARVAATMERPERHLHVCVQMTSRNIKHRVYTVTAAAELTIRKPQWTDREFLAPLLDHIHPLDMPRIVFRGPVARMHLDGYQFRRDRCDEREATCAAISMQLCNLYRVGELPAQLCALHATGPWVHHLSDVRAFIAATRTVPDDVLLRCHINGMSESLTMRWGSFRRLLLENAAIRLGPRWTIRAGMNDTLLAESSNNTVIDEPFMDDEIMLNLLDSDSDSDENTII